MTSISCRSPLSIVERVSEPVTRAPAHPSLLATAAYPPFTQPVLRCTATVDSDGSSAHTSTPTPTPSLRAYTPIPPLGSAHSKDDIGADVDSTLRLARAPTRPHESSAATTESPPPPPFSAHNFHSRYFPASPPPDPYHSLVTQCAPATSLTALAPLVPPGPAPPFEEHLPDRDLPTRASSVVAETKAALPRDTKERQPRKDLDDGEPPPPYTEGSSPLDGFTYVMAAAGGAASILTQVQQGGPAPITTAFGGRFRLVTRTARQ